MKELDKINAEKRKQVFSMLEGDLESAFNNIKKEGIDLYEDIMTIVVFNQFNDNIGKLYKAIGDLEKFTEIIEIFSDYMFKFPNKEDFKKAITLSLVFYYKEIKKMEWKDIQKEIPYENDIPIRYGKKVSCVRKEIQKRLEGVWQDDEKIDSPFNEIF